MGAHLSPSCSTQRCRSRRAPPTGCHLSCGRWGAGGVAAEGDQEGSACSARRRAASSPAPCMGSASACPPSSSTRSGLAADQRAAPQTHLFPMLRAARLRRCSIRRARACAAWARETRAARTACRLRRASGCPARSGGAGPRREREALHHQANGPTVHPALPVRQAAACPPAASRTAKAHYKQSQPRPPAPPAHPPAAP